MSKKFTPADLTVLDLVKARREEFYPDLDKHGVTLACVFVTSDTGPALKLRGRECWATIRKISQNDRASGCQTRN